jgi:diadenosine tetraphosphatase ApaH/serine/threonine PP2A family protein phosphatase
MKRIFSLVERYCFQGHTHVPGVFVEQTPDELYQFHSPEELDYTFHLDDHKSLVNVGSVGQPRDTDPRACYVLLDGNALFYRRVEYDIESTIRKIYAIPELENFLGDRLREGR